jgi:zinc transporter 9
VANSESSFAVVSAIVGNTVVACAKFAAFAITGSGAILSEAIHSVADVMNQALLYMGMVRSRKLPDDTYQYGYGRERFVWSLVSAVGIFFLGCGVSIYHGIQSLMDPKPTSGLFWAIAVLLFALVIEGMVLLIAAKSLYRLKGDLPFLSYLRTNADPPAVAVLLEDAAACIGVLIALTCILLAHWTGHLWWDAIGSILIGILLGAVAIFLVARNRELLIGQSISAPEKARLREILNQQRSIDAVINMKSEIIDTETYDLLLGIRFNGRYLAEKHTDSIKATWDHGLSSYDDFEKFTVDYTDRLLETLGQEIDDIEAKIRVAMPRIKHIDIEPELTRPLDRSDSV